MGWGPLRTLTSRDGASPARAADSRRQESTASAESTSRDGVQPATRTPRARVALAGMVLLGIFVLSPLALAAVLDGSLQQRLHRAGDMVRLLQNITVLGAAVVLRYEWHLSRSPSTAWLSIALGFLGLQNLPFSLLLVAGSELGELGSVNGLATLVTGVLTVTLIWLGARGVRAPVHDPLALALSAGLAGGGMRLAAAETGFDPTLRLSAGSLVALNVAAAALAALVIVEVLRCRDLPRWFRRWLVAATVLLTLSSSPAEPGHGWLGLVGVLVATLGVVLLLGAAVGLLRATQRTQTRRLLDLARRVAKAEAEARAGQERTHELTATVAGIAHASRLLTAVEHASQESRERLAKVLQAELARLDRMLSAEHDPAYSTFALSDAIEPVVAVQQALGQQVHLEPTHLRVRGRFDDLAEVFHILLTNAARHAPEAPVTIGARPSGDKVEVWVKDEGRGIAPSVSGRLFEWRVRAPGSPGSGIGLNLALRLVRAQGGDLREEPVARGACFVVTLPAANGPRPRDSRGVTDRRHEVES